MRRLLRMAVPPLSVALITLNEAENLRRCLESVRGLAAEIVIVDSGSTDGTRAVADEFQARWFDQKWLGFREQKNIALDHCQHDWVLCLDADEALSPELANSIRQFLNDAVARRILPARIFRVARGFSAAGSGMATGIPITACG